MAAEILVNCAVGETRVALLEDAVLRELFVERNEADSLVGSIYKGRVSRVLPGIQAAFVEVGLARAAFLYVDDVLAPGAEHEEAVTEDLEASSDELPVVRPETPIQTLLSQGQEVVVQVRKAPLGSKGARVSTQLTIPGRYLVYMPLMPRIGISRRIVDEDERRRLRTLVSQIRGDDPGGFIVRTVCQGIGAEDLSKDMAFVRSLWAEISERARSATPPAVLQRDLDLVLRATRDLFTDDVARLVADERDAAERIKKLLSRCAPSLAPRVELFEGPELLFDAYGVERQIERALSREIQLKSGATIVLDESEALTAIDVNTGRFVGSEDQEATILRTNLEAAMEIAAQIRLRDLGGIIIIDFIDMRSPESREQVVQSFHAALSHDRAKTHTLSMSGLGLLEMTRKRVRPSLGRTLTESCPYCEGRGRIRSRMTVGLEILREVRRQARLHPDGLLVVSAMPQVAALLSEGREVLELEARLDRSIIIEAREDLHQEIYQVTVKRDRGGAL